ncbi:MAG: bifunctional anthranilate synthase component II/anthranilate phosphoribosyltransferase [Ruminococcus sp.]|nr:bifunctional anthranilate synthase component II/anthranilate phosphoribosyltransferase [Ruminococcus sp.]
MIVMIDNYDSFTYNLYQYIGQLHKDILVFRNDEITIPEIEALKPDAIVISPGPAFPKDAGISIEVIKHFAKTTPILGVCLGHQAIAEAFGGKVVVAKRQLHGKSSVVKIDASSPIFKGLKNNITVARYHSLIVEKATLPDTLKIIAVDPDGEIMAIKHKEYDVYGVQFHPESILTKEGMIIMKNFLNEVVGLKTDEKQEPLPTEQRTELKPLIAKAVDGEHLTQEEARQAVDIIMSDRATNAQTAALLTAMRMNVETPEEITGCALGMRGKMTPVEHDEPVLEIVGTGGDLAGSFNISTTSMFVIASSGQAVAKHGNRSVSSKSGAADVLEELGVKIASTPEEASKSIKEIGISFLFAQSFHKAMRFVGPVRGQIGVRTVFNILGPLTNPADAEYNIIGVYEERLLEIVANVLKNLGVKHSLVVHGDDGLDELSISDCTTVCEIDGDEIKKYSISPESVGLKRGSKSDIIGGNASENAQITLGILKGEIRDAKRDIVLLNSGAALYVSGKADSIEAGVKLAGELIDNGSAYKKLEQLIEFSNRVQ